MTPNRLLRLTVSIGAAAALVTGLAACHGDDAGGELESLTIGLTYTPNVQFSPFYVAEKLGYFEEAGLDVELRHHGEAEELFGALASDTEQVVYAGGDEIMQARSTGIDVTSIGTIYNTYPAVLIVPEDSDIRTAADARGHTIGTPGPYGQTYFALLSLLQTNGLTSSDVDIQHIGYTQQAALTSGKVDGVMGFVNNDAVQFAEAGFPVRTIEVMPADHQQLVGPAIGATQATIEQRGPALAAVTTALARALDYIGSDPQGTIDIAAEFIPTLGTDAAKASALATLEATLPLFEPHAGAPRFQNDPQVWSDMASFMAEQGLLGDVPVTAEESYTNDFVPNS